MLVVVGEVNDGDDQTQIGVVGESSRGGHPKRLRETSGPAEYIQGFRPGWFPSASRAEWRDREEPDSESSQ